MNHRTTRRIARRAVVAVLFPPLLLSLQGCDSGPTATPDPCPTIGKWALGGGSGTRLDARCAWSGVITLSHTQSTEEEHNFIDPFGTENLILGQSRQDREIKIQLTAGRAEGTVEGTWTGTWDVTTVQTCEDGQPGENVQKMVDDYEMQISGTGEAEVILTIEPDGAYRLEFTAPHETWDKSGTVTIHYNDTCQDPPFIMDYENTESDREETFYGLPFTVRGKITPGDDLISGADEVPLPIIEPFEHGGKRGTIATVYSATWKLERKN